MTNRDLGRHGRHRRGRALEARGRDALAPGEERWAGVALEPVALYGVRRYRTNAVLRMHVDRPRTHVISSIIHIANDLAPGQRWPLRIFSHDGTLHEVDFAPGEMVIYESARLVHGRPLALPGSRYANLFTHFAPRGWEARKELLACTRAADVYSVAMGGGLVIGEMRGRWRFQDERLK